MTVICRAPELRELSTLPPAKANGAPAPPPPRTQLQSARPRPPARFITPPQPSYKPLKASAYRSPSTPLGNLRIPAERNACTALATHPLTFVPCSVLAALRTCLETSRLRVPCAPPLFHHSTSTATAYVYSTSFIGTRSTASSCASTTLHFHASSNASYSSDQT
ncbi:hypothetical protein AB1Y20_019424 [Prymnesium parvum]|uniref:Uncharacterized protein n=1 Tax=Prymnesium parvum TaxID=97485 RepID=A0AB34JUA9_PRYPA